MDATRAAVQVPEVQFARSGDVAIAYQVVGDGPLDLVLVHGWLCTFHLGWERPQIARFYRRLASMGRLILFDKRGTGLSDRVFGIASLEERMDDVRAVLDAVGSERAAILGVSEGGPLAALYAATYPDRTAALVLIGTFARTLWAPDYPIGVTDDVSEERLRVYDEGWPDSAVREWLSRTGPSLDESAIAWYVTWIMRGGSPAAAKQLWLMNREIDVRGVLPTIRVPTLALYRAGEYYSEATPAMGRAIPGAKVIGLPGDDHLPWEGDQDALLDEVEEFITGSRRPVEADRVLATVLFTDIVGSTERAAELGDRRWRALVQDHHAEARRQIERFRGVEVDTAGDGFLIRFDGPARAIRCAGAIRDAVRSLGLELRAGVHIGECEIVGEKVTGIAVHTGARVSALAKPGEVLVSSTVKDLVAGSGIEFEDRGTHELKGVPGEWWLYAVKQ
jgi:pimeloyl-ACP methyl ester carboxylesterase